MQVVEFLKRRVGDTKGKTLLCMTQNRRNYPLANDVKTDIPTFPTILETVTILPARLCFMPGRMA